VPAAEEHIHKFSEHDPPSTSSWEARYLAILTIRPRP
jgi:hypothetical protein